MNDDEPTPAQVEAGKHAIKARLGAPRPAFSTGSVHKYQVSLELQWIEASILLDMLREVTRKSTTPAALQHVTDKVQDALRRSGFTPKR